MHPEVNEIQTCGLDGGPSGNQELKLCQRQAGHEGHVRWGLSFRCLF